MVTTVSVLLQEIVRLAIFARVHLPSQTQMTVESLVISALRVITAQLGQLQANLAQMESTMTRKVHQMVRSVLIVLPTSNVQVLVLLIQRTLAQVDIIARQ